jgi:hypothetical protein
MTVCHSQKLGKTQMLNRNYAKIVFNCQNILVWKDICENVVDCNVISSTKLIFNWRGNPVHMSVSQPWKDMHSFSNFELFRAIERMETV